jgi:hypothetical protein
MTVFALTIVLFVGVIYWGVNMHRTVEKSQPLMCSIVTVMHDIQHGYKDEKITFAGIGGLSFFLKTLKNEAEKLKNSSSMDNIINRKLSETSKQFADSITAFYNDNKAVTVKGCKPVAASSGSNDVTPGVIKALTDSINEAVKVERDMLANIATKVDGVSKNVKDLAQGGTGATLLESVETFN